MPLISPHNYSKKHAARRHPETILKPKNKKKGVIIV